jgi:hypothetical protein
MTIMKILQNVTIKTFEKFIPLFLKHNLHVNLLWVTNILTTIYLYWFKIATKATNLKKDIFN